MGSSVRTAANIFVPNHSLEAVLEQLCTLEVARVLEGIAELLPDYRAVVDSETYERDQVKVRLLAAYISEGTMSVFALTTALNCLLKQQKRFTGAIHQGVSNRIERDSFQLQCQDTGVVKAYMRMTRHKAGDCNVQLANEESRCRWTPISAVRLEHR